MGLGQQRMQQRRAEYAQSLRAKSNVKMLLDPPRTVVSADDDPAKGPADAPVTIITFSDFQCPYCSRVNPTLARLKDRYGDSIRVVFRDFPILQIHPQAAKAAEAGACANDQGKFWPMHDLMFANQQKLDVASLKQHAATAGPGRRGLREVPRLGQVRRGVEEGLRRRREGRRAVDARVLHQRPPGHRRGAVRAVRRGHRRGADAARTVPIPPEKAAPVAAASPAAPPAQ